MYGLANQVYNWSTYLRVRVMDIGSENFETVTNNSTLNCIILLEEAIHSYRQHH